jgi:hypothetical protein
MVVFDMAFPVLNLPAFAAGSASVNGFVAQLNKFGFDTFVLKNLEHCID